MSTKKRVQFNEKKKVKKFKNDSDEDGGVDNDDEEFGEFEGGSKNKKHTLDSDEEDNSDEIVKLNRAVFKDIGQEAKTSEFDNEIKLTPFNMKDELDEGDFDKDGYYHWKKDVKPKIYNLITIKPKSSASKQLFNLRKTR